MRVRTGRFGELRSRGEPRQAEVVEELVRQRDVDRLRRVSPPASTVRCDSSGRVVAHPARSELAIDGRPTLPMFELQRAETMADPLVELRERLGSLHDVEVA